MHRLFSNLLYVTNTDTIHKVHTTEPTVKCTHTHTQSVYQSYNAGIISILLQFYILENRLLVQGYKSDGRLKQNMSPGSVALEPGIISTMYCSLLHILSIIQSHLSTVRYSTYEH